MEIILLISLVVIFGFSYKFFTNDVWAVGLLNSQVKYSLLPKVVVEKFTIQKNDKRTLKYYRRSLAVFLILATLFSLFCVYYFDSALLESLDYSQTNEKPLIIDFSKTEN